MSVEADGPGSCYDGCAHWNSAASATSRSSPTSTTASPRSPTACWSGPARSATRDSIAAAPRLDGPGAREGRHDQGEGRAHALHAPPTASEYELNLIDTPGHVDFAYEVSRALVACEGALLVVDAAQGVQAQTLANLYAALENDLTIIPVINKIDLPNAEPERVAEELARIVGFDLDEMIYASAKEGTGTDDILEAIVERIPPPAGRPQGAAAGADLRLQVRLLQGRHRLRARRRRPHRAGRSRCASWPTSTASSPSRSASSCPASSRCRPRVRRGRLRGDRPQERARGPRRRHDHAGRRRRRRAAARLPARQADGVRRPLPGAGDRLPRCCATPSRSCTSATPPSPTSRSPASRSASASAAASSASSTWRSCRSAWSASTTSTCIFTAPSVEYQVTKTDGTRARRSTTRPSCRRRTRSPRSASPGSTSRSCCRTATSAPSWS